MATIHVDVVSATGLLYSGHASCVFAPATMGEIGIYPKHTALLSTLKPGEVRIKTEQSTDYIYVSGGIIEVQPNTITIFSDTAIRATDLNENKALEAKKLAEETMANANIEQDLSFTKAALAESIAQLQMISKRRKKSI